MNESEAKTSVGERSAKTDVLLDNLEKNTKILDEQLEALGVQKIDPENKDQILRLEEIMLGAANDPYAKAASTHSDSEKPDFAQFAGAYSIYDFEGQQNIDGELYRFVHFTVVDDRGYGGLTQVKQCVLLNNKPCYLEEFAKYTFNFGMSQYLGTKPYGWFADWTIGAIWAGIDEYNQTAAVATREGNGPMYSIDMCSVTQMRYVYIYIPTAGWQLCGAYAPDIKYSREDRIAANIGGEPVTETLKDFPMATSRTGNTVKSYMQAYMDGYSFTYHEIGKIQVNSEFGITETFTPVFARSPLHLI